MCTKFEVFSFSRCIDISGGLNGLSSLGWDLIWSTCLPTLSTHYEDTKGNAKSGNWRWFWRLWVIGNIIISRASARTILYSTLIRNYTSILYRFRVKLITSYLSKFGDFNLPHLHLALLFGWLRSNFTKIFGVIKSESLGYRAALFPWFYV